MTSAETTSRFGFELPLNHKVYQLGEVLDDEQKKELNELMGDMRGKFIVFRDMGENQSDKAHIIFFPIDEDFTRDFDHLKVWQKIAATDSSLEVKDAGSCDFRAGCERFYGDSYSLKQENVIGPMDLERRRRSREFLGRTTGIEIQAAF